MPTNTSRRILGGSLALASIVGGLSATVAPAPAHAVAPRTTIASLDVPAATGTADGKAVIAQLAPTAGSFDLVGLTWQSLPTGAVPQVRAKGAKGWSAWTKLEISDPTTEGTPRRKGTDATYLGASTEVEVRVLGKPGQRVTALKVELIDSTQVATDSGLPTSSGANGFSAQASSYTYAAKPTIVTRAQWGANESWLSYNGSDCVPANLDTTIKAAIVHHTAGANSYTKDQSASIVRGIYAYHVKSLGWCDVGYNFLVDKYGQVFEGRHGGVNNPVHGAHATSWNTNTVGISVMMDSSTAVQTDASMAAVTKVLAWKLAGNYRDPQAKLTLAGTYINRIARHGDVMQTACPGTNITRYMPTLRDRVAAAMGNWQTPIYQAWEAQGGETGILGSPTVLERPITGGRLTDFTGGDIYQRFSNGRTYWMSGAIASRYQSMGRIDSWLGWPVADQQKGDSSNQSLVQFANGRIYYSSSTGAHAVSRATASWLDANPALATTLGYPKAEAVNSSESAGTQAFAGGTLAWDGSTYWMIPSKSISYTSEVSAMGDLNGDARADLISVQPTGALRWYPTTTAGKAGSPITGTSLAGKYNWASQVSDLDGDGKGELVARDTYGKVFMWRGTGGGGFTAKKVIGTGWKGMRDLTVAPDMDGDGLPEILAVNASTQQLHRYSLAKDLRITKITKMGGNFSGLGRISSIGDITGGNGVDVLAIDGTGRLWSYHGTTAGGLTGDRKQVGSGWRSLTRVRGAGDVNGDGRWDLVAWGSKTQVRVYLNTAAGLRRGTDLLSSSKGLNLTA